MVVKDVLTIPTGDTTGTFYLRGAFALVTLQCSDASGIPAGDVTVQASIDIQTDVANVLDNRATFQANSSFYTTIDIFGAQVVQIKLPAAATSDVEIIVMGYERGT